MVKRKNILFICIIVSLVALYFVWKVLGSINGLYFGRDIYGEELFGKYLILNWTQMSCVGALLVNIWTTYILFTNGQLQVANRGQIHFNILEIVYLVVDTLVSIVTYIIIANFYMVDTPQTIWSFITTLNMVSVGFLGGSIIAKFCLRKQSGNGR